MSWTVLLAWYVTTVVSITSPVSRWNVTVAGMPLYCGWLPNTITTKGASLTHCVENALTSNVGTVGAVLAGALVLGLLVVGWVVLVLLDVEDDVDEEEVEEEGTEEVEDDELELDEDEELVDDEEEVVV